MHFRLMKMNLVHFFINHFDNISKLFRNNYYETYSNLICISFIKSIYANLIIKIKQLNSNY